MTYAIIGRHITKATFIRNVWAVALTSALLLGIQSPVSAEPACATHEEVTRHLADNFAEVPIAIALASDNGVIEVFSRGDGATWTMVVTRPDGKSCIVASGEAWENWPVEELGPEA